MAPQHTTIDLHCSGRRQARLRFDGGPMSADGGALLLQAADRVLELTGRMAACFQDHRDPARCEHSLQGLIAQRLYGLALGYQDVNDHDSLRDDRLLALALGRSDVNGQQRLRSRDQGHPLAGSSTLNRLELGRPEQAAADRYKRIVADAPQLDTLLVELFLEQQQGALPQQIVLDVDATDDPLHGEQEGRYFHGHYDCYCYLPLYVSCGSHLLSGQLRQAHVEPAAGAVEELARIVGQIRQRWPQVAVIVRGDAGFCREDLMAWCEQQERVDYVFGLAQNARLQRALAAQQERSRRRGLHTGRKSRRYRDFRYRTLQHSWSRTRRVVGKAEWLPGEARNNNLRFVVTSLTQQAWGTRELYEQLYCARGDMENRIKEQQLDLFADRTSAATMRANQLRLHWALFAAALLEVLRGTLAGTALEKAQFGTIRVKLLKLVAAVKVSVRRIWVSMSSLYPRQELFAYCLARLRAAVPG